MQRLKPVDIAIAGGGWVGLAMAKEIATRTSLSVVVLERGPGRSLKEYASGMDEVDYLLRYKMMQNLAEETVTHRHSVRDTAVPIRQYGSFNPGTGVGGAGEHWSGLSYRFLPDQFRLASALREKHGSKLPADLSVQDWGISYDELEPLYWRAEHTGKDLFVDVHSKGFSHRSFIYLIDAYTAGYLRDISVTRAGRIGVGADATVYQMPDDLKVYWASSRSFHVFLRWRPVGGMRGMQM